MKILFIYPDVITKMINFCPSIHVLSAVLKREGYQVFMLHINNEHGIKYDKEIIIKLSAGYDLFGITSTTFNYKYANEIAGWLKEAYPSILRILGGFHATTQPEDFKASNFDIFCVGEGEEPIKELVYALNNNLDWSKIPNLITRSGANPVRGFLRNLNTLPFWDFTITNTKRILEERKGWLSISFARGCPYECTFCYNNLLKKIEIGPNDRMSDYLRRRNPDNAVNELFRLAMTYPVKFFNLDDDLLTTDKKWMNEFTYKYKILIYRVFGIKYVINARASTLDDEMVSMLADSGCKEARMGFETGNEELRNSLLNKKTSNESLEKACATLDKHGVMSVAFAMMGVPGESLISFFDTIHMTIKLKPKLIRMTFLFPYKNTKIYDYCIEHGLLKENYELEDNRDLRSPLKFEHLTDQQLFCFRFLFPWFVNATWLDNMASLRYFMALSKYIDLPLAQLEGSIPEIIELDSQLSKETWCPHYRYYSNNIDYFQLYDNI